MEYKLRDWIPLDKLDWSGLSKNPSPGAIELLEQNQNRIDWNNITYNANPDAMKIIEKNINKISNARFGLEKLSQNPNAASFLEKNPKYINWQGLSSNPSPIAIKLLEQNKDKIHPHLLAINTNPKAMPLLEKVKDINDIFNGLIFEKLVKNPNAIYFFKKYPDKIKQYYWSTISENSSAVDFILENYPDKLNWHELSKNPSPKAIELLEKNPDKIDWEYLAMNKSPDAIKLLEKYPDKLRTRIGMIGLMHLSANPNAVTILEKNRDIIDCSLLLKNPSQNSLNLIKNVCFDVEKLDMFHLWKDLSTNPVIFQPKIGEELGEELVDKMTENYPKTVDSKFIIGNVNKFLGGRTNKRRRTNKKRYNKRRTNKRRRVRKN
jgi:hypothetical protein